MVFGLGHHHEHSSEEPRGRPVVGTGRGGAGNILTHPSESSGAEAQEDEARAQPAQHYVPTAAVSSGRGGVGNVRSPSRDPADRAHVVEEELHEQELRDEYRRHDNAHPHGGRGGLGNVHHEVPGHTAGAERGRKEGPVEHLLHSFSRSRSRDTRSRDAAPHD